LWPRLLKNMGFRMIWMLMEVLLGKKTYLDKIPHIMRRLNSWHLDGFLSSVMLKQIESKLHKKMG